MKVVLTGSSGLMGRALVPSLREDGHEVVRLVRRAPTKPDEARWDPPAHHLDPDVLADADAVVHLAGTGIGDKRWSRAHKASVLDSRVDGTTTIAKALATVTPRPRVLVSASAIGWYGDSGGRPVDETAPAGTGFLADVVRRWEESTAAAEEAGVRVVRIRSALVLSPTGGLMGRLRPLFRFGLGGRLGNGTQYWSWISLEDEVAAIRFLLDAEHVRGPVNLAAPDPVTNAEFTRALGRAVHRPAILPVPPIALRIALGGFADEGVLAGQRVVPKVLLDNGFTFRHPTLDEALAWVTR